MRRPAPRRTAHFASHVGATKPIARTGKVAAMPKPTKTRSELESLVLAELLETRFCAEARSVTVISLDDDVCDANWAQQLQPWSRPAASPGAFFGISMRCCRYVSDRDPCTGRIDRARFAEV
jgi:hypothetical protein